MKNLEEIKRRLPYIRRLSATTFCSEVIVGKFKGSVVFSDREDEYEHVSFSPYNGKIPDWDAMCQLKDMFWCDEEEVYQIMPKKSEYVNIKDNCLHLWKPCNGKTLNDLARM